MEGKAAMKPIAIGLTVLAAWLFSAARLFSAAGPAAGDVFVLSGGGRISGRWLNADEFPRRGYVIQTPSGGRITLADSQVERVLRARPEELQYEQIRHDYADTVRGQWELAQWCRQKRLPAQREKHLRRVIELEADHAPARHALGYTQLEGKWVIPDEVMIARGYARYRGGRWRTAQEIELIELKRKTEVAEKDWLWKLRRWRSWLGTDRDPHGRRNILAIKDPHAVKALTHALDNDDSPQARVLYVEALASVGTTAAAQVLAACSLQDPVEEVRLTCLDYLQNQKHPDVVAYFVGKLQGQGNPTINLAAMGLARLKDPSAVGPLIDALITTHTTKVPQGNPGSMTTTFGTGPGGSGPSGLSVGGSVQTFTQFAQNQSVLDALVAITGENFSFDQRAWKYWHAMQRERASIDARRD